MSINKSIATFLASKVAISAVIGTRINPENVTTRTMPYLRITRPARSHVHDLSGGSGLATATIQIDAVASTVSAADALAELVRLNFQGYQGTAGAHKIRSCILVTDRSAFEDFQDHGTGGYHMAIQRYEVTHEETIGV